MSQTARTPLNGTEQPDELWGTDAAEMIQSHHGDDQLWALGGDDFALGGAGNDRVYAGDGNDVADGGYGDDRVYGGQGDDVMSTTSGYDQLYGDEGNDQLSASYFYPAQHDATEAWLDGGKGDDILMNQHGQVTMTGGHGNDQFVIERNAGATTITDFSKGDVIEIRFPLLRDDSSVRKALDEHRDVAALLKHYGVSLQHREPHEAKGLNQEVAIVFYPANAGGEYAPAALRFYNQTPPMVR